MFDIKTPKVFFRVIRRNADILRQQTAKETDRLLFVILGLNHLREWIAPDYRHTDTPSSPAEQFYNDVFDCPAFKVVNRICNHTKHLASTGFQETGYGLDIDSWPDVDSVESFDAGPPTSYEVDGQDVLEVVDELIDFYQRNWFDRS